MNSRYEKTRKVLIFWCLFIGIGAVFGATGMLVDPTGKSMGMDKILSYFEVLPFADVLFQNYTFPGIALLVVNGITNITASILLFKNKKLGIILGGIFGITLMLWITIQFIIFPMNFMSIIYFIFGIMQALTGYMCYVFYKQSTFEFNVNDYKNISINSDTLVVYFSRMNYTKKIAYEIADKNNAEIYEIKALERTEGTSGFWWCGRYGMHNWMMPIKEDSIDFKKYKRIIICSPIWVFNICAPVRTFIDSYYKKISNCDLVLVHFNNITYNYIFKKLIEKYDLNIINKYSVCSRLGKVKYYKKIN
jgi:hypothetical protein